MRYAMLMLLMAVPAYAMDPPPEPLQSPHDMNVLLNECKLGMIHNPAHRYVPESRAERVCTCGVNKMARWSSMYASPEIPFWEAKDAIGSCMREIRADDGRGA
jgi:hypothetical protein